MRIRISPTALEDLCDGRDFYDERSEGLGDYFFNSLFADIDSLRFNAGIHMKQYGGYRLLARRFPFAVYYSIEHNRVLVRRVLDLRRDPERNRKAIEDPIDR